MKLTNTQFNELLNQHIGTGYMFIKMNDSTVKILDIYLGKSGNWCTGANGVKLLDRLSEITIELTDGEAWLEYSEKVKKIRAKT